MNGDAAIPAQAADVPATAVRPTAPIPAVSFIDAGDMSWLELAPRLARSLAELLPGEVLELQTGDRDTILTLPGWCAGEGHTLIHTQPRDGVVSFWIGKVISRSGP